MSARVGRAHVADRLVDGIGVGELEDRLGEFADRHRIDHDLTSAHTGAFPPPPYFLDATARSIADGRTGYTSLSGDPAVRDILAPRLAALLGTPVARENIVLTAGTQAGLYSTLSALVEEGDVVLMPDVEYLCDERVVRYLGGDVRRIPFTRVGNDAALDLDVLEHELQRRARVFVFSSPHNPTGSVFSAEFLERLAELIVEHDAWVVADGLYARFVYGEDGMTHLASLPGMSERCVTAIGPSKTESASGYRIGALVGPAELLRVLTRVVEITTVRAPAYSQYALEHWLVDDEELVRSYLARYRALRDITVDRFADIEGVQVEQPAATAWLFPDVSGLGRSDQDVAQALIEAGILVKTGSAFGPAGKGCLRMCFGQPEETWPGVLDLIASVFDTLRAGSPSGRRSP